MFIRTLGLLILGLLLVPTAASYEILGHWPSPQTTLYVDGLVAARAFRAGGDGVSNSVESALSQDGVRWDNAFVWMMNEWSSETPFTLFVNRTFHDPCNTLNLQNGVDFRSDVCGDSFGANVLAVAVWFSNGLGELNQSNIIFNDNELWDRYRGPMRWPEMDFDRVALHELGHFIGLAHESGVPSIMVPSVGDVDTIQADDIEGVCAIYGGSSCPPGAFDLVVSTVSINDSTPAPGQLVGLFTTVHNQGSRPSETSTTLRYYRSTNSIISRSDVPLGTDSVPGLVGGGTSPESISVVGSSTAGTYYLGACVDAVNGEASTTNQCSAGVEINVFPRPPDLVVSSASVSDSTPAPGQSINLFATVHNQGARPSETSTTLRYYRSTNSIISRSDVPLGTDSVPALGGGGNSPESISVVGSSIAGIYYLGACVDAVAGEASTTNQCSAGVQTNVGAEPTPPDLAVLPPSVGNSIKSPGQAITLNATVRNQGSERSSNTTIIFYRSQTEFIDKSDHFLVAYSVPPLNGAGSANIGTVVSAPPSVGTYYLGACVQSFSTTPCSLGTRITVAVVPTPEIFSEAGGYAAYLAEPTNADLLQSGICDEASAFAHWRDFGFAEGRTFAQGQLRTDNLNGSLDPDYAIDGGFAWEYPEANTVVFITADARKPEGWAGLPLLLERCQTFNIGAYYSAQAYRGINTDVGNAIDQGLVPSFQSVTDHYVKYGFKEGRLTSNEWSEAQVNAWNDAGYLSANPDVANYFQGAANSGWSLFGKYGFAHWINFGQYEGRGDGQ